MTQRKDLGSELDPALSNWSPVSHKGPKTHKKSIKRRARKRRICSCALRAECRFICGGMSCPQRRRFRRRDKSSRRSKE